jgi:hypothetical protein
MAENLLCEELQKVDSHELRVLLDEHIGGPGQYDDRRSRRPPRYFQIEGRESEGDPGASNNTGDGARLVIPPLQGRVGAKRRGGVFASQDPPSRSLRPRPPSPKTGRDSPATIHMA